MLTFKTFCEEKSAPIRDIRKKLADAGFTHVSTQGSHEKYKHPNGHSVVVSHHKGLVSPGVVRQVRQTISAAASGKKIGSN